MPEILPGAEPSWFGFFLSLKENIEFDRLKLINFLEENNVGTRLLFSGNIFKAARIVNNHYQLRIKDSGLLFSDELSEEHYKMLPNTELIMNNTFWIGLWHGSKKKI